MTSLKIVRTEYNHLVYTVLAEEAIKLWRDPLFENIFHETGWLVLKSLAFAVRYCSRRLS
jgi:sarcosine oxidase / L-pipecolate oxidase